MKIKMPTLTYEDVKMMYPEYPYVIATVNDVPLQACKTESQALCERELDPRTPMITLKIVDVRLL